MSSKEKKEDYTWSVYPQEVPEIKYKVKTLPLQNEISQIRKVLCRTYSKYEGNWSVIKTNTSKKYGYLKDQLASYGIQKDSYVVQGGAVGGATLLGYLLGRKGGIIKRFGYPLMGGALVGGAYYISYPENRKWVTSEVKDKWNTLKSKWPTVVNKK